MRRNHFTSSYPTGRGSSSWPERWRARTDRRERRACPRRRTAWCSRCMPDGTTGSKTAALGDIPQKTAVAVLRCLGLIGHQVDGRAGGARWRQARTSPFGSSKEASRPRPDGCKLRHQSIVPARCCPRVSTVRVTGKKHDSSGHKGIMSGSQASERTLPLTSARTSPMASALSRSLPTTRWMSHVPRRVAHSGQIE